MTKGSKRQRKKLFNKQARQQAREEKKRIDLVSKNYNSALGSVDPMMAEEHAERKIVDMVYNQIGNMRAKQKKIQKEDPRLAERIGMALDEVSRKLYGKTQGEFRLQKDINGLIKKNKAVLKQIADEDLVDLYTMIHNVSHDEVIGNINKYNKFKDITLARNLKTFELEIGKENMTHLVSKFGSEEEAVKYVLDRLNDAKNRKGDNYSSTQELLDLIYNIEDERFDSTEIRKTANELADDMFEGWVTFKDIE